MMSCCLGLCCFVTETKANTEKLEGEWQMLSLGLSFEGRIGVLKRKARNHIHSAFNFFFSNLKNYEKG